LYTGSRHTDITNAALMPTIGRGYVDTKTGIFKRKPDNKKETSKKQPTIPLHPRLLSHIRRWQRKGISKTAVVEYRGKPVGAVKVAWDAVAEAAGFSTDKHDPQKLIRHSLRHSAISWFLTGLHNREQPIKGKGRQPGKGINIETVALYCGVSPAIIRKHYRHETENTYDEILGRQSG
jgi:integrase